MYFHTDDDPMGYIEDFGKAIIHAAQDGRRVRINVDGNGSLTYKIGEGGWSPPFYSTPDPYRDNSQHSSNCRSLWPRTETETSLACSCK